MYFWRKYQLKAKSDEELLKAWFDLRDEMYFEEVAKRYSNLIMGVCLKYLKDKEEASDATIVVLEKLFLLKENNIRNLQAWLHTITKNLCLGILEKNKKTENRIDAAQLADVMEQEGAANNWWVEIPPEELKNAINELKPQQKECIHLFYLEQKSYNEISALTGLNNNEVKSHIQNGKRNLKLILEKLKINDKG